MQRILNAHEVGGPPDFPVGKRVVHSGETRLGPGVHEAP